MKDVFEPVKYSYLHVAYKSEAAGIIFFYTTRNEPLISSSYILGTPGIKVYVSFNKVGQTITTRTNSKLSYWVYGYYVPMRTVLKDVFLLLMFRTKGFQ